MLQHIRIRNLALLEEVTLEFESGFTAVTGETGAGKSVLLGALGLLSGARTDKGMIRQGQNLLEVEAALHFADAHAMDTLLEASGLPVCEDGVLLLQRSIHRSKIPRIQINGSMATLAQLQSLGESWIDFHGPGEPQKLFQEKRQLEMLDGYAGSGKRIGAYREAFAQWRSALREIESLETGERLDADELEFVRKQIKKIDAVDVSEESIEELERDYARMSSAQELVGLASACSEGLIGEQSVNDLLGTVLLRLEELVELDEGSEPILERARSMQIELQDLGEEVGRLAGDFDFDAEAIEAATERMNLWQELRRKYGGSVEAVRAKRHELAQKIAIQSDIKGVLAKKQKVASELEAKLRNQAAELTEGRAKAAKALAKKAAALLQALGFKKARLEIQIIADPNFTKTATATASFFLPPTQGRICCR